ncbi:hypothetical protein VPK24_06030 [Limnothrix redekei LRLZ20PSL1]|uniref:Uncharacterized protein n=1 Tax=Limnothrix redekei LRLZ20PSL1 TaxID=3112953 RepID=A0ABW7C7P0_9CYAN
MNNGKDSRPLSTIALRIDCPIWVVDWCDVDFPIGLGRSRGRSPVAEMGLVGWSQSIKFCKLFSSLATSQSHSHEPSHR